MTAMPRLRTEPLSEQDGAIAAKVRDALMLKIRERIDAMLMEPEKKAGADVALRWLGNASPRDPRAWWTGPISFMNVLRNFRKDCSSELPSSEREAGAEAAMDVALAALREDWKERQRKLGQGNA